MNRFSLSDCNILWNKRKKPGGRDRVAIKTDLETMSKIVGEAMTYTRDKVLKENRETMVRFWLNTGTRIGYYIEIHYDAGLKAWGFSIDSEDKGGLGEIVSEKWPFLQILLDEDVEAETF